MWIYSDAYNWPEGKGGPDLRDGERTATIYDRSAP
jgi:hypothetical protein